MAPGGQRDAPRICFVNKMDRIGADFKATLGQIETKLQANPVAIQLPISEDKFKGVVDLARMKAITEDETMGADYIVEEIPELQAEAKTFREKLIEGQRSRRPDPREAYLGGEEISEEPIGRPAQASSTRSATKAPFVVVICGSAFKNKGVQPMLDAVVDHLPSPLDIRPGKGSTSARRSDAIASVDDTRRSRRWFKIMIDPFVGQLTFLRVYSGVLTAGWSAFNATRGKSERTAACSRCTPTSVRKSKLRWRHRRGGRPEERDHRRHDLRREAAGAARGDGLPAAGHLARHRAEDQGRPGSWARAWPS